MTSRTKIAQRVAYDVRAAAFKRLRREAGDRLTDDEMEELADWIETRVEEDVNGRLKVKAAEKHGHDLVPDGGEQTVVCYGCGAYVPRRQTEGIDVSPPDEYYPDMRALCPDCSGGNEDDDAELVTDGGREYEPIYEIRDGTCRYYEGEPGEEYEVKHEGGIEIYPNWVRLTGGPARKWVPREQVEGVSEL